MPATGGVTVEGFRELQRLFALADKETQKEMKTLERQVAEPVRGDAEAFAGTRIWRITPRWATMRVGITRILVYVAPKQRGVRSRQHPRARPGFATLLMERAMQPAADRNQPLLEQRTGQLFNEISRRWNGI
jgi:hypothetical protein